MSGSGSGVVGATCVVASDDGGGGGGGAIVMLLRSRWPSFDIRADCLKAYEDPMAPR